MGRLVCPLARSFWKLSRLSVAKRSIQHAQQAEQPRPSRQELQGRLAADIGYYGSPLPERVAIAWRGFFSALVEWSLLSVEDHDHLLQMLPRIVNDPVNDIMSGRF